jgi:NADH:ubiquinone oxidoreductase subunit 4 (subunit M)
MSAELAGHIGPIRGQDKVALVVLAGLLILIGIYPAVMAPMIESGASAVLRIVGGA